MNKSPLLGLLVLGAPLVAAQGLLSDSATYAWFAGLGVIGIIIGILAFIFWVWMLVDSISRPFRSDVEKVVWILMIIFLNILGAIIYYFAVRLPGGKLSAAQQAAAQAAQRKKH